MRKKEPKKEFTYQIQDLVMTTVTRFVNNLMLTVRKATAFKVFYDALDILMKKLKRENVLEFGKSFR